MIDISPDRIYLGRKVKTADFSCEGRAKKCYFPLKQIKVEQLEGYRPPIPDWNYFFWLGCSDEEYENFRSRRTKTVMYEAFGEKFPIQLKVDKYSMTGNLAIEMVNWKHRYPSSWAALTVDLNEVCEKDCSYVDTNHHGRKILSWIIENGLGELTGQRNRSGYCTYEKIRFYPEKLKDCDPEGYQRYKNKNFEET